MDFTPDLLDDFLDKKVAIFIGAGVSAGVNTRTHKPILTWSDFIKSAALKTGNEGLISDVDELLSRGDYLFSCELLKDHYADDWEGILRDEYEKIGELSQLQKKIISLKQRIIVTTNFDLFIDNGWERVNDEATHYIKVKNGVSAECFSMFRDNENYLVKLHGSINNPETMIFSLSDYASKAHANWQYSMFMDTLLMTHTVLFVGFSMNDHVITDLLDSHAKKYPKNRPHYAFLADCFSERKIRVMKKHRKLFVIPYSSENNHAALPELFDNLLESILQRKKLRDADIQSASM
ncbi:SIR2 family protein [Aeromonas veronii]